MRRPTLLLLGLLCAAISHGAALGRERGALPPPPFKGDPYERFNRKSWEFNQKLDQVLVRPLAFFAHGLTPGPIGKGLHNFVNNLNEPVVFVNEVLQHRIARAFATVVRAVINSTIGLLGTVDVAAKLKIPHDPNGFADTLGRYGVGPGPYLYLPVLGPSTVRDLFGTGVDLTLTPLFYISYSDSPWALVGLNVLSGLDTRANADADLRALLADAADPYATLRSTYLQMRQGEINAGRAPAALPEIEPMDPAEPTSSPSSAPTTEDASPTPLPSQALDLSGHIRGGGADPAGNAFALDDPRRLEGRVRLTSAAVPTRREGGFATGQEASAFAGLPGQ